MDPTTKTLIDVFLNTVESFAYMFAEPYESDEAPPPPERCLKAQMSFIGPMSGAIALLVPEHLCPIIAANALGCEPEEVQEGSGSVDALKELLNVTCGRLLTALAGEKPVFDLTVPVVSPVDAAAWESLCFVPDTAIIRVEDAPVLLHFARHEDPVP